MKKRTNAPKVILANRLDDGRVVFFSKDGGWSITLQSAAVAHDPDQLEKLLEKANISADSNLIVSPQPVDATLHSADNSDQKPSLNHIKYDIQSKGPTVRPDLGYQAEAGLHYGNA